MAQTTNKIFYGPPGTGKTWRIVEESLKLALDNKEYDALRAQGRSALQHRFDELAAQGIIELVTFHPSYTYEDFVEGLRPITTDDDQVIYEVVPGVLRRIAVRAIRLHQENLVAHKLSDLRTSQAVDVSPPFYIVWDAYVENMVQYWNEDKQADQSFVAVKMRKLTYELQPDEGRCIKVVMKDSTGSSRAVRVYESEMLKVWSSSHKDEPDVSLSLFMRSDKSSGNDHIRRFVYKNLYKFWQQYKDKIKAPPPPLDLPRAWDALVAHYTQHPASLSGAGYSLVLGVEREADQARIVVRSADNSLPQKTLTRFELESWLREHAPGAAQNLAVLNEPLQLMFSGASQHRPAFAQAAADLYTRLQKLAASLPAPPPPPVPHSCVLIIDEINRGNISKIFGELMTIVEPSRRLGASEATRVRLPLAGDDPDALFGLPSNLHLLGTMNTADRSIALMDVALRRRFEFVEIMPDPQLLARSLPTEIGPLAAALLTVLNQRLALLLDRDHLLGHATLMSATSLESLRDWLTAQVIPLLQEYFYGDWSRVALVLGCPFTAQGKPVEIGTAQRLLDEEPATFKPAELFYNQWRDAAPLRLIVNPALANATGEPLRELLLSVLPPEQRAALRKP
jgi:hypothetical protein